MISEKKSEMIESPTDLNESELKRFPHSRKLTTNIYLTSNKCQICNKDFCTLAHLLPTTKPQEAIFSLCLSQLIGHSDDAPERAQKHSPNKQQRQDSTPSLFPPLLPHLFLE